LPSQSTEDFPNHHLAESQPPSNSAIADALGLETQNRTIAWGGLGYRTICGSSLRADQGTQSSRMQALLEATQGSCGVTERACQIVLIGVSGFVQRNQGIGFGGAILPGVVRVDDAWTRMTRWFPSVWKETRSLTNTICGTGEKSGKRSLGSGAEFMTR